ncbi:MAG: hypothetical protein Q9183_007721, partial [Haloplaca sp. 2 TL-2023]
MHLSSHVLTLLSVLSAIAPSLTLNERDAKVKQGLRLIKTSAADSGTWAAEDDKIHNHTGSRVHFIDITDIKDPEVLARLSGDDTARVAAPVPAITYPGVSHQAEANGFINQLTTSGPQSWLQTMTNFYNRYYSSSYGTQSSTWLFNTVKSIAAPNSRITVTRFSHSYNQPSIIARIPGSSPSLIIVGAHFDSTGGSPTARAPGADDNGSGCVVLMEALRVLANARYTPRNTMEFHFYSGEEGGLRGSGDIWRSYKSTGKNVKAFVNTDMAGYSPSGKISSYNDYSDQGLLAYVRRIASAYLGGYTTDT